ncbi:MAG: SurA N-terminal domain-containing protein, partial [Deltaproteobacteria bacterium]|nr:SurA N-terminal domain-containing protein [Deltaproteobacteria bacterium]
MLETLRKAGNSKYILFVFGIIILVFIFWGVGPTDSDRGEQRTVAKVDGRSITAREYRELLKRQTEYYKGLFKGQFNDEAVRRLDLKHKSLDILISRALALKAAEAEGVIAAEKDVQDAIKAIPAFGKDGVFDRELYFRALSANRIKPAEFEKSVETDIVASRMRERVIKGIAVTNEEVMRAFLKEERKYNLSYIAVDPKAFEPSVRVDEAELKAYFEKNPSDFIVPVRIKAFYAFLGFKEFSRGVKVTDDGVKAYYGLNKGRFYAPPQALARHILITPDGADADMEKAKNDARAKAEEILRRVKSGESFASLAKKYSKDTVSAEAGGGLGWFPRGVMVREFEDAVFSLKKGEVSGIVETQFGFHIILLEDKREAREQPLEEVEAGIRETLAKDKGNIAARDAASDLEKEFRGAASIEGLSRAVSAKPGARH